MSAFVIGNTAGHRLRPADLTVYRHVACGERHGYFATRKWLANRAAFNYDPTMGWAIEHWFEWPNEPAPASDANAGETP